MLNDAPKSSAPRAIYKLSAGPYQAGELHVLSFEGSEEMNNLYAFDILVCGENLAEVLFESTVLGVPASLTMNAAGGEARSVHGIVSAVVIEGRHQGNRRVFRLTIVPRIWFLGRRANSRIFQDLTVQQVVDAILDEHGIDCAWRLYDKYPARQYCVQYQESDEQFVRRILAEEGIFFSFEHPVTDPAGASGVAERIVFSDSVSGYSRLDGDPVLLFRPETGSGGALQTEERFVSDLRVASRIASSAVVLRDYDFKRPLLDLTSGAGGAGPGGRVLEVYEHHGEYEETDVDKDNARIYLEQLRAGAREAHGVSGCRRLVPGNSFDLVEHEIDSLNAGWVVTQVEHRGVAPESGREGAPVYENRFRCVPASVPFRPTRPARLVRHVQESAIVVGPEQQEIYADRFGRIKVQFHWDRDGRRDEKSSCWLRVMQPWAGPAWGAQFIPRIGMEVLVSFLGGDQDRPVVVGCLYNAKNPPPYSVPELAARSGIRTRSTPNSAGWNEVAFDDRAGREQIFIHAERDLEEEVGNDHATLVGRDRRELVEHHRLTTVRGDRTDETSGSHSVTVRGGRSVRVEGSDGAHVGGSSRVAVDGESEERIGGVRRVSVGGSQSVEVQGDAETYVRGQGRTNVDGSASVAVAENATVTVSGALTLNAGQDVALAVGTAENPRSATATIAGSLGLNASGGAELVVDKEIRIRCGKSVILIRPEEIAIESGSITLSAGSIHLASGGAVIAMTDEVKIKGASVKASSDGGAILELSGEAMLDGPAVKLKPGLAAEAVERGRRAEQAKALEKVKIHLFDRQGRRIVDAPYEVSFFGYLDEGTSPDGTIDVPNFPDVEQAHVRWGRPQSQRDESDTKDLYEFEMDVFLTVDPQDEDEALRRKLHNLGHRGVKLHEAVDKMQATLGRERTGLPDDVRSEVEARHAALKPVEKSAKGT